MLSACMSHHETGSSDVTDLRNSAVFDSQSSETACVTKETVGDFQHGTSTSVHGCFIDTGCSRHMTWNWNLFMEYTKLETGECQVALIVLGAVVRATVRNVLHVPSLAKALISHAQLGKVGIYVEHVKDYGFYLREGGPAGKIVGLAPEVNHLYPLQPADDRVSKEVQKYSEHHNKSSTAYGATPSTSIHLWHQRLAHLGLAATRLLPKFSTGMPDQLTGSCDCLDCLYGT
ncbi:hypothetical protein HOY82DRAFT_620084 [Tuber indicum]|nr:hypothetical protein HOY82DRAFT_620084 [Tuber indicum]